MAGLFSAKPVRHGQTPARRLHPAGKRMLWRAGRGFVVRDLPGKSFTQGTKVQSDF